MKFEVNGLSGAPALSAGSTIANGVLDVAKNGMITITGTGSAARPLEMFEIAQEVNPHAWFSSIEITGGNSGVSLGSALFEVPRDPSGVGAPLVASPIQENKINTDRKREFAAKYIPCLRNLIRDEPFEAGVLSRADHLMRQMLDVNSAIAKECIEDMFRTALIKREFDIAAGAVEIIGRLDEREANPQGQIMSIAALSVKHVRVQEAGIRAFENWSSHEAAAILGAVEYSAAWLKDYADAVIAAIRAQAA